MLLQICPCKAQVKRVVERFGAEGVQYHRCLTVGSAQGSESKYPDLYAHEAKSNFVKASNGSSRYLAGLLKDVS